MFINSAVFINLHSLRGDLRNFIGSCPSIWHQNYQVWTISWYLSHFRKKLKNPVSQFWGLKVGDLNSKIVNISTCDYNFFIKIGLEVDKSALYVRKKIFHFGQKMDLLRATFVSIFRCPKHVLAISQFARKFVCIQLLCDITGPQIFNKSPKKLHFLFAQKLILGCFWPFFEIVRSYSIPKVRFPPAIHADIKLNVSSNRNVHVLRSWHYRLWCRTRFRGPKWPFLGYFVLKSWLGLQLSLDRADFRICCSPRGPLSILKISARYLFYPSRY